MEIYDFAMQMEKDGENYYRELALKTRNAGLKSILGMLADAEVKHYNLFHNMKEHEKVQMTDTTILNDVKNVFMKMKEEKQTDVDVSETDPYRKAQEIEKKSMDLYTKSAGEEKDQSRKGILLKIADEEKRHFFILERIIDFVNRPAYWLENPEWYHLEDY